MKLTREDIQKYGMEDERIFLETFGSYSTLESSIKNLSVAIRNKNWRAAEVWLKDLLSKVVSLKGERNEI